MNRHRRPSSVFVILWLVVSMLAACTPTPTPAPTPTITPSPTPIPLDEWGEEGYDLLKRSDFAGAEAKFKQVIEADEDYGPAYVGLSQVYYWQTEAQDEALAQAQKAVEVDPENAEAYAVLALAQVDQSAPSEAVEAGEKAVELDETSAFAYAALAQAYLDDRQYEEAQEAVEQAVALDPEMAEVYGSLATFYWDTADFARARAALEKAIALEPKFAGWHVFLGYYWLRARRYDLAEASLKQALELAPDHVSAVLGLAGLHRERNEYEEAEVQFEHAAQLAPDTPDIYVAWGYLYLFQEEYDEALARFNEALEKEEDYYDAQNAIGDAYLWQQECDTAVRQFQDMMAAQPRYADGQVGLGYARACEGDTNKALETFRKALDLEPYNASAQIGLGYTYALQGRWEDAIEAYVEALHLTLSGANTHSRLGLALWLGGGEDTDAAKAEYELALVLDPYLVDAHTGLGDILLAEDEAAEAQEHAEEALSLDESNDDAQMTLGAALVIQGQAQESLELLEQVVEEDPENAFARFYLALAYRAVGRYSDAKKELETYIALRQFAPEDPARQQLDRLVEALDQGYRLTVEKAISDLEELFGQYGIEPDINIEEAEGEGEGQEEEENNGRTLVISLDIPPGQEQQDMAMLMAGMAALCAPTIPRIDPPVENGLLIRLEEWGRPKFTAEVTLADLQEFADGFAVGADFISSIQFTRLVADESTTIREIQTDTAEVRELDPKAAVPSNAITQDELHERLTEVADDEYQEGMEIDDAILTLLGVIEPDLDLAALMIDLYTEQVAGFYDTDEEAFYVLQDEEQTASDQMTIAHEYVHALQDQHFDLETLDSADLNSDEHLALDALIEGDATLAMMLYAVEHISLVDRLESVSSAGGYESGVFDTSPAFIQEMELFPYIEGYDFVLALHESGGWEAVNEAYENPPGSAEQVLHPERYREGDEPQEVSLPDLVIELREEWVELDNDVLGELGLRLTLAEYVGPAAASAAAEGWAGDRYALLQQGEEGPHVLVMQTYWDDQDEADEFQAIYQIYMAHRTDYTEDVEELVGEVQSHVWLSEGSGILVSQEDQYVTIVVGPDEDTVEQVMAVLESQ
jgi:tetratricopeptide (TPR) repeat protein